MIKSYTFFVLIAYLKLLTNKFVGSFHHQLITLRVNHFKEININ